MPATHSRSRRFASCPARRSAPIRGEVAVELLAIGDPVVTLTGAKRRIRWIGTGKVLATPARRNAATPVIVRKSALDDNVPSRDLHVTKGHSLYFDGALIPVEFLINHRTILWDDRAQEVTVYHIELETHDVLLANGAPAESYRDDGNRWLFQNHESCDRRQEEPCAPVLTGGPVVDAVWRRLVLRAGQRKSQPMTDDPGLHLVMNGRRLDAVERVGDVYVFRLPVVPSDLHIVSRAASPAKWGLVRDPRLLGVALQDIAVRQGTRFRVITPNDARLSAGFHAFEPANGLRWTNGDATLPDRGVRRLHRSVGTRGARRRIDTLPRRQSRAARGVSARAYRSGHVNTISHVPNTATMMESGRPSRQ